MMIFSLAAFSFLALAGSSLAQGAYFAYPQNGATLVVGNITIRIDRPVSVHSTYLCFLNLTHSDY